MNEKMNLFKFKPNVAEISYKDSVKLTRESFVSVSHSIFNITNAKNTGFRKLNREKDAIIIDKKLHNRIEANAEKVGFYRLNGFANVFRRTIKISYVTLYERINKSEDLKQYLIDNDFIFCFFYNDRPKGKEIILVNYDKRFELAALIIESFLTTFQRDFEI